MATLLVSQGVPMLLGGDEFLRTQRGNNNAWCQDNATSWVDWTLAGAERRLPPLRPADDRACGCAHPALRRRTFFTAAAGRTARHPLARRRAAPARLLAVEPCPSRSPSTAAPATDPA